MPQGYMYHAKCLITSVQLGKMNYWSNSFYLLKIVSFIKLPQDKSIKLKTLIRMHKRAQIIKVALKPPRVSQSKRKAIRDIKIVSSYRFSLFFFYQEDMEFHPSFNLTSISLSRDLDCH